MVVRREQLPDKYNILCLSSLIAAFHSSQDGCSSGTPHSILPNRNRRLKPFPPYLD